jgi:hypothetical protein
LDAEIMKKIGFDTANVETAFTMRGDMRDAKATHQG